MMSSADLKKNREILFSKFPPGQVPEAAGDLERLEEVDIEPKFERRSWESPTICKTTPLKNLTSI
jgi:hypothetical protein